MGERSPASQGVKRMPPDPGGAVAARSVSSVNPGPVAELRPSLGAMTWSRSHCKHAPLVSWLLATRYWPGRTPGTVAIWRMGSVFLKLTGQLIHDVVLIAMWRSEEHTSE